MSIGKAAQLGRLAAKTAIDQAKGKPPQKLPRIFQPNANGKPFFEDLGEFVGGVSGLVPTSKDLAGALGTTISGYLSKFKKPPQKPRYPMPDRNRLPQELPAIFKPHPANGKNFFQELGEFAGGAAGLVPTSKDLGGALGTTISGYLSKFKKPPQ